VFTAPVAAFIDNPGVELNVPPAVPVKVTGTIPALEQYGLPA
jgi:hypothetical protein